MKGQLDEGGGRILLGDNTSGTAIMPKASRRPRVGVLISSGLPCINTLYVSDDMFSVFRLARNSTGTGYSGT